MKNIHKKLTGIFNWYDRWHKHPRHSHAHWFGLFVFIMFVGTLVSSQVGFFYSDKMEVEAQTLLPAPNHSLMFGYYLVNSNYGNYLNEVSGFNNTQVIYAQSTFTIADAVAGVNAAAAAGQKVIFGATTSTDIDAAASVWNKIDIIYLADEPTWDQATAQSNIAAFKNLVTSKGLSQKPVLVNFTSSQILNGTGYLATNLDIVGFESYVDPSLQNDPNLISLLSTQISQMKAKIGNRKMIITAQGYARNYCPSAPTYCWSNLTSLQSIQTVPYMSAYNDANVIGITIFSYARPTGTREIGDCLINEHKKIWGAMTGGIQPASASCGGGTIGGGTPPAGIQYKNLGNGTFPDVTWHNGRVWLAVQQPGGSGAVINLYSGLPDLTDWRLEKTFDEATGGQAFPRLSSYGGNLWMAYRNGSDNIRLRNIDAILLRI
jgi:hypothetical protein